MHSRVTKVVRLKCYIADEIRFFDNYAYNADATGLKAQPLAFHEGEAVIDGPGLAATHAQWRSINEQHSETTGHHRQIGKLMPLGLSYQLTVGIEIWLPDDR